MSAQAIRLLMIRRADLDEVPTRPPGIKFGFLMLMDDSISCRQLPGTLPIAARRAPMVASRVPGDGPGVGHDVAFFAIGELPILRAYFRATPRLSAHCRHRRHHRRAARRSLPTSSRSTDSQARLDPAIESHQRTVGIAEVPGTTAGGAARMDSRSVPERRVDIPRHVVLDNPFGLRPSRHSEVVSALCLWFEEAPRRFGLSPAPHTSGRDENHPIAPVTLASRRSGLPPRSSPLKPNPLPASR